MLVAEPGIAPGLEDYAYVSPITWSVGLYHLLIQLALIERSGV